MLQEEVVIWLTCLMSTVTCLSSTCPLTLCLHVVFLCGPPLFIATHLFAVLGVGEVNEVVVVHLLRVDDVTVLLLAQVLGVDAVGSQELLVSDAEGLADGLSDELGLQEEQESETCWWSCSVGSTEANTTTQGGGGKASDRTIVSVRVPQEYVQTEYKLIFTVISCKLTLQEESRMEKNWKIEKQKLHKVNYLKHLLHKENCSPVESKVSG